MGREEHRKPRNSSYVSFFLFNFFSQLNLTLPLLLSVLFSSQTQNYLPRRHIPDQNVLHFPAFHCQSICLYISQTFSGKWPSREQLLSYVFPHWNPLQLLQVWNYLARIGFFTVLIHEAFYCFLPFLIILCPVSFKGRSTSHCLQEKHLACIWHFPYFCC